MSIHNKSGTALTTAYNLSGQVLTAAYSKNGTIVFQSITSPLKIMTYNVGGWYDGKGTNVPAAKDEAYYELQYGTISDNDPDILFIEEYWDQFSQSGRTAISFLSQLFPYVYPVNGNSTYFGRCFCSKYPLSNYQQHLFSNDSNRYYDTIVATVENVPVTLCVLHLGLTVEARAAQAQELLTFAQSVQTPFIMAGDFNTAKSATVEGEDYINVIKPFIDEGYKVSNCGDFGRFITYSDTAGTQGQGSLDNIVFSPHFTIQSVEVDDRKLHDNLTETADHMPLIAVVSI